MYAISNAWFYIIRIMKMLDKSYQAQLMTFWKWIVLYLKAQHKHVGSNVSTRIKHLHAIKTIFSAFKTFLMKNLSLKAEKRLEEK